MTYIFTYRALRTTLTTCFALAALVFTTLPSYAQGITEEHKKLLDQISDYLNDFTTVQGGFIQNNPNGTSSSGDFFLQRPGQLRFDYHPPYDNDIMLVDSGTIAIFDEYSNSGPQLLPLHRTPLAPLLERSVDLRDSDMIYQVKDTGDTISVWARDVKQPQLGNAEIKFTKEPLALTGWALTDHRGLVIHTSLTKIEPASEFPPLLFSISREEQRREDLRSNDN